MAAMRKRVYIVLSALLLAVVGLATWEGLSKRDREPVYQGRGLRVWLKEYRSGLNTGIPESVKKGREAEAAIRVIGTNAIPTLLRMLRERNSATKGGLVALWERHVIFTHWLPRWVRSPAWYRKAARFQNEDAAYGFGVLGTNAQQAVPALIGIYEGAFSQDSRFAASRALAAVGPAAGGVISTFLRGATNRDAAMRQWAVMGLDELNAEPHLVVPALAKSLSDTNWFVRTVAAEALGRFGKEALQAVPALVQSLKDTNKFVRGSATYALTRIDPVAAANAGVNTNIAGLSPANAGRRPSN